MLCATYRFYFEGINRRFHTGMILVDLQKAFDPLDHTALPKKMECNDLKESVIKWVQFYLSSRKFFVTLEDAFSDDGLINCGIPQRSILESLLFLFIYVYIHINVLLQALIELKYLGHTSMLTILVFFIKIRMLRK